MTTDRDNERVADAYREIATETTRPELDEKILKLAASDVRPKYGLTRAWTRPLAWAATIALSVALVLQITQDVDDPVAMPAADSEPAVRQEALEERARNDADAMDLQLMKVKEEKDAQREAAKRMHAAPEVASPVAMPEPEPAEEAVMESAPARAEDRAVLADSEEPPIDAYADAAGQAMSAVVLEEIVVAPASCSPEVRASADDWYSCVEDLRDRGLSDAADAELEALETAFPEFEPASE